MNIQILDSWLRVYLKTNAKPTKIADCMSLCGPSCERLEKKGNDWLYDFEVTTNRVDMMSVYGLAREAAAILPQFGTKATLVPLELKKPRPPKKSLPLKLKIDRKLSNRLMGVVITDIENWKSPDWMKKRLNASGIRSLNSVVDITNYIMVEIGHPSHVFDYDLIKNQKIIVRESRKGEKIISLDNKEYTLPGGDIVFDDGTGEIIDLPGIMGTKNSVVNKNTKRVLFFFDNNDPTRIRRSSMSLGIRTVAATLNEKGVDPELAEAAMLRGIQLFEEVCKAKISSKIYDQYPDRYKVKTIKTSKAFIDSRLGISIYKKDISKILESLEFETKWRGNQLEVKVPSFRALDVNLPEDIIEEVARINGYYNLPSELMEGQVPSAVDNSNFKIANKIKATLKALKAVEVYTSSLVSKEMIDGNAIKLQNPLGSDTEYMRDNLRTSLLNVLNSNKGVNDPYHVYEIANIYLPQKNNLPLEEEYLAGLFVNYNYRDAKGIIETLLDQLNISTSFKQSDLNHFIEDYALEVRSKENYLGKFGVVKNDLIYYEFSLENLIKNHRDYKKYKPIPKFPAQIEDITLKLPKNTKAGEVLKDLLHSDILIRKVELTDMHKSNYTFRLWYQSKKKTLNDKDVEKIRTKLLKFAEKEFGAIQVV